MGLAGHPLHLYRHLLRALRKYPSVRRKRLIADMREEFRDKRELTGEQQHEAIRLGLMELHRLGVWAGSVATNGDINVNL
mmetsp:Transcript_3824/g.10538  ORF Transcript_3824/g.10538 Transcript_3824/m.10538 type:complete len:80 (-) Transcript_3824:47-286(-)